MVLFGFLSIFACLRVCGASPPIPLITKLTAVFGDTVVLPCDGSYYAHQLGTVEVERALGWSTMGEDVLSHQGEGLTAGPGYEGRVFIPPERFVKGNFSLDLQKVGLSDANIYECIWQGRKTISTVWLHVDVPSTPTALDVPAGHPVLLPCYGLVPKDPTHVIVGWQKDGLTILTFHRGSGQYWRASTPQLNNSIPNTLLFDHMGKFTLIIDSVGHQDEGYYSCFYRPRTSANYQSGTPEAIHLTVNYTRSHEDNWEGYPTVTMLSDDLQEDSTETSAPPVPAALATAETSAPPVPAALATAETSAPPVPAALATAETSAPPVPAVMATVTPSVSSWHLARGQDEAMTSSPEPDIARPETFPWVRIGIIGGVLSLTALVLGILLATHKI